jgi:hypothetical protein
MEIIVGRINMKIGESLASLSARLAKMVAKVRKPIVIKEGRSEIRLLRSGLIEIRQKERRSGSLALSLGKKKVPVITIKHPWIGRDIDVKLPSGTEEFFSWIPGTSQSKMNK